MEGKTRKVDKRVTKTKKAIKEAFITLLADTDFSNITIKSIADIANVDRKTIYNYYDGIYAIVEDIENDSVDVLQKSIQTLDIGNNLNNPKIIFQKLNSVLESDFECFKKLMKIGYSSNLIEKIIKMIENVLEEVLIRYGLVPHGLSSSIVATFYTSAFLGVYHKWFELDNKITLAELSNQCGALVISGLSGR